MLKLKLQCFVATWWEKVTHLKRLWCWERLKVGTEGDDRGWDGWMVSLTQWTWIWGKSGSWWWTGMPGVLQSMESQSRTLLNDWTELNWRWRLIKKDTDAGKIEDMKRKEWERIKWLDASPTQCTWVWANSGRWWRTGKADVLRYMGLWRVGHDWLNNGNNLLFPDLHAGELDVELRTFTLVGELLWYSYFPACRSTSQWVWDFILSHLCLSYCLIVVSSLSLDVEYFFFFFW